MGETHTHLLIEIKTDNIIRENIIPNPNNLANKLAVSGVKLLGTSAEDIDRAEAIVTAHGLPFNREGWEIIVNDHAGMLPVEIEADSSLSKSTIVQVAEPEAVIVLLDAENWLIE